MPDAEREFTHVVREADGSLKRFTSQGVNVQAYGPDELSATDSILQTGRGGSLISLQWGKRWRRSEGYLLGWTTASMAPNSLDRFKISSAFFFLSTMIIHMVLETVHSST